MIIWHAPTEPPKEGIDLLVLYINYLGRQAGKGWYTAGYGIEVYENGEYNRIQQDDVLAWTEYNMPEWVNSNRKEKE